MHIEFLVEDSSGSELLNILLPQLLGPKYQPHTWDLKTFQGIGKLPKNLNAVPDPKKKTLLDNLPLRLKAYGKSHGFDAVVVVLDLDNENYKKFSDELMEVAHKCAPNLLTIFNLAIEETEAWYLGDQPAVLKAYPHAKRSVLSSYKQDTACGTWELLADAVHPGGSKAIKKAGWPLPGQIKHKWAENIGKLMTLDKNESPSFNAFRDGMRQLAARTP